MIEFLRASTMSLSSVTESLQPLRNSRSSLYSNCNRGKAAEVGKCHQPRRKLDVCIASSGSSEGAKEGLLPERARGVLALATCRAPRPGLLHELAFNYPQPSSAPLIANVGVNAQGDSVSCHTSLCCRDDLAAWMKSGRSGVHFQWALLASYCFL